MKYSQFNLLLGHLYIIGSLLAGHWTKTLVLAMGGLAFLLLGYRCMQLEFEHDMVRLKIKQLRKELK